MTAPQQLELINPALPRTGEAQTEEAGGGRSVTIWYGPRGGSAEARLVIKAKSPAVAIDEHRGILATGDKDAAISGIANLFDVLSSRLARERWKPDLDRYLEGYADFDTWAGSAIQVNGRDQDAFRLQYADAAAHVSDLGDVYLIVVTVPPADVPSVHQP